MGKETVSELISERELQDRIDGLAAEITRDYSGCDLVLVGLLKGAVIFMSDLARKIDMHVEFDFMDISSYGSESESSGNIKINKDLENSIEGKDVLLVEDIIDTGRTLEHILKHLRRQNPKSLRICALLDKPDRRVIEGIQADYTGFSIPDKFVVGYGLDYAQRYRNLRYIAVVELN